MVLTADDSGDASGMVVQEKLVGRDAMMSQVVAVTGHWVSRELGRAQSCNTGSTEFRSDTEHSTDTQLIPMHILRQRRSTHSLEMRK